MPAVRHCSVGPPRSAIHGRVAATPASCRGAHCAIPACGHRGLTGRLRSKARSKAGQQQSQSAKLHSPVGAGLPAMAVYQSMNLLADLPSSRASPLLQGYVHASITRSAVRPPRFACDFDLKRPVKPRWPSSDIDLGGNPAGRRVSRAGPGMAHRGGPPNQCRMTGTPSLGEVPSGGARALCLLWGFSKVSRRKGGTLSGHDRSNGYVHKPKKHQRKESRRYSCLSQPHQSSTAPTSGQCDSSTIPRSVALLADGWRTPRYSAAPLRMHDRQPHANAELITTRDLEPGRALAPPIVLPARRCVTRCFDPSGFCLYKKTARNTPC
jgi:hypothetical protein